MACMPTDSSALERTSSRPDKKTSWLSVASAAERKISLTSPVALHTRSKVSRRAALHVRHGTQRRKKYGQSESERWCYVLAGGPKVNIRGCVSHAMKSVRVGGANSWSRWSVSCFSPPVISSLDDPLHRHVTRSKQDSTPVGTWVGLPNSYFIFLRYYVGSRITS